MSTAEATFSDAVKSLGDSLVNLKVLDVLGPHEVPEGCPRSGSRRRTRDGRWRRRRRRCRSARRPLPRRRSSTFISTPLAPRRSTSSRSFVPPRVGPEGGEGPRRGRAQGDQDRSFEGRRRETQEGARRVGSDGFDQVNTPTIFPMRTWRRCPPVPSSDLAPSLTLATVSRLIRSENRPAGVFCART